MWYIYIQEKIIQPFPEKGKSCHMPQHIVVFVVSDVQLYGL